jgi:hypothetical protein
VGLLCGIPSLHVLGSLMCMVMARSRVLHTEQESNNLKVRTPPEVAEVVQKCVMKGNQVMALDATLGF